MRGSYLKGCWNKWHTLEHVYIICRFPTSEYLRVLIKDANLEPYHISRRHMFNIFWLYLSSKSFSFLVTPINVIWKQCSGRYSMENSGLDKVVLNKGRFSRAAFYKLYNKNGGFTEERETYSCHTNMRNWRTILSCVLFFQMFSFFMTWLVLMHSPIFLNLFSAKQIHETKTWMYVGLLKEGIKLGFHS